MRMYEIIEKKRDGAQLTYEEIQYFVDGYSLGSIPDYQVAALLMAIFIRGMSSDETATLTILMAQSGDVLDLSVIPGIKVDKHSTGGVGDKTTLVVAPMVAACGVPVAKMSGRALGHTGGTIDKLESIKGLRTSLTKEEFIQNVQQIGISISGQTGNLAPADKKLYALRDVTATIDSIPLIASSIMSKKMASGADRIVLDVKCGSGAFMKSKEDAIQLAQAMVDIGHRIERKTLAMVTDMNTPLGHAIGNTLEVIEALETLKGRGPHDFESICIQIAAQMLYVAEMGSEEHCIQLAKNTLLQGTALEKLSKMIERQGGDPRVIEDYRLFQSAAVEKVICANEEGYIHTIRTDQLGVIAMLLGAGRETKVSEIDYSAGMYVFVKPGVKVNRGDPLVRVYTSHEQKVQKVEAMILKAFVISPEHAEKQPTILGYIK